jgi:hypothetical protein
VLQCSNGVVLGLFSESRLERQFGAVAEGFRGWGVAVKYGSDFDDRGGFIYP